MKLYRFSPVKDEAELREAICHIHNECMKLCKASLGEYLPVAGNVGFFCHYDDEYEELTRLREKLCEPSDDPKQKYYLLHEPIVVEPEGDVPGAVYTHLYIRKPDIYRAQVGDIDFVIDAERYAALKKSLEEGKEMPGARIFPRADLDMIELYHPDSDALGYVSVNDMAEKVRIKQV